MTLLHFPVLRVHLLAPAILFVVLPVPDVVITIAVDLSPEPITALVLDLTLVDVAVRLCENEPADAIAYCLLRIVLAVERRPLVVGRFTVSHLGLQWFNRVAHDLEQPDRAKQIPRLLHKRVDSILVAEVELFARLSAQHVDQLLRELLLEPPLLLAVVLDSPED